jgi:hypothetical protein
VIVGPPRGGVTHASGGLDRRSHNLGPVPSAAHGTSRDGPARVRRRRVGSRCHGRRCLGTGGRRRRTQVVGRCSNHGLRRRVIERAGRLHRRGGGRHGGRVGAGQRGTGGVAVADQRPHVDVVPDAFGCERRDEIVLGGGRGIRPRDAQFSGARSPRLVPDVQAPAAASRANVRVPTAAVTASACRAAWSFSAWMQSGQPAFGPEHAVQR